jgi:hypothetical protein
MVSLVHASSRSLVGGHSCFLGLEIVRQNRPEGTSDPTRRWERIEKDLSQFRPQQGLLAR